MSASSPDQVDVIVNGEVVDSLPIIAGSVDVDPAEEIRRVIEETL